MGGGGKSGAPAALQDLPPPGLSGPGEPLDEAVGLLPQAQAHQQYTRPARPRKYEPSSLHMMSTLLYKRMSQAHGGQTSDRSG